jgi:serine/threonine-protein kinase
MIGQQVGKYQILDRVGRGGMGTVYRAIDQVLQREVAIKALNAELNDAEVSKRFRAEAVTVARLNHPGIATIYELFEHEGQWLMVMEFVRGETLEHMVDRMGSLTPQRSAEFCMQALTALAHAHSLGVVHRDLKPANLMVTDNGTIKIMDFGIARVSGSEHLTGAGFMMGTPAYMSPEQVMGHEIDSRADLYSMGVVFYRLSSGKLPFKGDTPFAMAHSQVHDPPTPIGLQRSDLPAWADQVVARALAKDREQRFQSAVEFYEAFSRCLAGLPMTTLSAPVIAGPTDSTGMMHTPSRMPSGAYGVRTPTPLGVTPILGSKTAPALSRPDDLTGHAPVHTPAPPPAPAVAKRIHVNPTTIGLSVAVVLLIGLVIYFWQRGQRVAEPPSVAQVAPVPAPEPPPPTPPPAVDPAAPGTSATPPQETQPATGTPAPPATSTPPPAVTQPPARSGAPAAGQPPASARGTDRGRAASTGRSGASRGTASGATSTGTSAPPATGTPPPAVPPVESAAAALPPVAFDDVRILTVTGKKSDEQEAVATFGSGALTVTLKDSGAALATLAYRNIVRATYVNAEKPVFDTSLAAPPPDFETPRGLFGRRSRHWLVIQSRTSYSILRLEQESLSKVIDALESRTGLKVVRSQGQP